MVHAARAAAGRARYEAAVVPLVPFGAAYGCTWGHEERKVSGLDDAHKSICQGVWDRRFWVPCPAYS